MYVLVMLLLYSYKLDVKLDSFDCLVLSRQFMAQYHKRTSTLDNNSTQLEPCAKP